MGRAVSGVRLSIWRFFLLASWILPDMAGPNARFWHVLSWQMLQFWCRLDREVRLGQAESADRAVFLRWFAVPFPPQRSARDRTISPCMFSIFGLGLRNAPPPQFGDSIIKNDVWAGDEIMMLGGGVVENGCIIAAQSRLSPNFRSEPYGVYGGAPARLIAFRFSEKIREKLLDLAWWEMPLQWIRENNDFFLLDLLADEGRSLEAIAQLKERKLASVAVPA